LGFGFWVLGYGLRVWRGKGRTSTSKLDFRFIALRTGRQLRFFWKNKINKRDCSPCGRIRARAAA
jgi:hypothetical protein